MTTDSVNTGTPAPVASTPAPAAAPTTPAAAPEAPSGYTPPPASTASERLFERLAVETPAKRMSWDEIQGAMNGTPPVAKAPETVPKPNSDGKTAEGAKVGDGVVTAPQPASEPTPQPAQSGVPTAEDTLRADLAARDAYIQQLIAGGTKPAGGQPDPTKPTEPVDDIPAHMYQLPQELLMGMKSEDPVENSKALTNYTSLVTRTIHKQLRTEYTAKMQELTSAIPAMVSKIIEHQAATKAIFEDFYGENKDLNKKELYPVILNTAMALMRETKATEWTPGFKQALAQRVRGILGTAQAAPATPPAALIRQPAMMNGGARPSATPPSDQDKLANEILGTLVGF